jgi:hypothetical protein
VEIVELRRSPLNLTIATVTKVIAHVTVTGRTARDGESPITQGLGTNVECSVVSSADGSSDLGPAWLQHKGLRQPLEFSRIHGSGKTVGEPDLVALGPGNGGNESVRVSIVTVSELLGIDTDNDVQGYPFLARLGIFLSLDSGLFRKREELTHQITSQRQGVNQTVMSAESFDLGG